MRINKYLASCGIASRRKCEEYIQSGKVEINGQKVTDFSFQVNEKSDKVKVDGKEISLSEAKVYYMLNKPKGVISAALSNRGETTVVDLIKEETQRLFPVGRLDKDSEGLIFLTNDGEFAYRVTHPSFCHTKRYTVKVKGTLDAQKLERLKKGVIIDGKKTNPADIRLVSRKKYVSIFDITISEGRNRQIRKMCEAVGCYVLELKRVAECGIEIGELKSGEYRTLTKKEIDSCFRKEDKNEKRYRI